MDEYPITRQDPGTLPEPPVHLTIAAASWWWKLAAWAKVRNDGIDMTLQRLGDVSLLLERTDNLKPRHAEIALMNANIQLAECGFNSVDLQHLDIPEHEIFSDHKQIINDRLQRWKAKPEH